MDVITRPSFCRTQLDSDRISHSQVPQENAALFSNIGVSVVIPRLQMRKTQVVRHMSEVVHMVRMLRPLLGNL